MAGCRGSAVPKSLPATLRSVRDQAAHDSAIHPQPDGAQVPQSQSGDMYQWVTRSFGSVVCRGLEGLELLLLTEHYYLKFLSIFHGLVEEGKSLRMVSLVFFSTAFHRKSEFYFLHRDLILNCENGCTSSFWGLGHLFTVKKVMDIKVK